MTEGKGKDIQQKTKVKFQTIPTFQGAPKEVGQPASEKQQKTGHSMETNEKKELRDWAVKFFKPGCYLGDLARSDQELTEEELFHLEMAYEGFLVGRN